MPKLTKAAHYLCEADPVLAEVIRNTSSPYRWYGQPDPYLALVQSIVSQQISMAAADAIYAKLLALFPSGYPEPRRLARLSKARLRTAGISRQKAGYLQNIARFASQGGLEPARLKTLDDEEVIAHLTHIKGVGRWTVEMLLMFSLNRPDVLPVDDLGIQQAFTKLYRLRSKGPALKRRMEQIARPWRPHRTLACKYLWRWKNTVV